jgi:hypothetical protein
MGLLVGRMRVITHLRADQHVPSNPLAFNPAITLWDAAPGATSDAACAASAPIEDLARMQQSGGVHGRGKIRALMGP